MDAIWTEMRCVLNISREDVEYVAVPNEAYKAIPITWPPNSGLEGWNEENAGNIWEAWAGTLWLCHQKDGVPPRSNGRGNALATQKVQVVSK